MFDPLELYQCTFSPRYWDTLHKAERFYHTIQDAFSQEFLQNFLEAHQELTQMEQDEAYRRGFQDGVLFMTRSLLSLPGSPRIPGP